MKKEKSFSQKMPCQIKMRPRKEDHLFPHPLYPYFFYIFSFFVLRNFGLLIFSNIVWFVFMMEGPLSFCVNNFPVYHTPFVSHKGKTCFSPRKRKHMWFNYLLKSNIDSFLNEWFIEFFSYLTQYLISGYRERNHIPLVQKLGKRMAALVVTMVVVERWLEIDCVVGIRV